MTLYHICCRAIVWPNFHGGRRVFSVSSVFHFLLVALLPSSLTVDYPSPKNYSIIVLINSGNFASNYFLLQYCSGVNYKQYFSLIDINSVFSQFSISILSESVIFSGSIEMANWLKRVKVGRFVLMMI